jgi:hypothetical protein
MDLGPPPSEFVACQQWFERMGYDVPNTNVSQWRDPVYIGIIRGGFLEVLKWAWAVEIPDRFSTPDRIYLNAVANGHLHILQWAHEMGVTGTARACSTAAQFGYIDILKWLRQKDCPWDKWTLIAASMHNHFEILKWAKQNGCPGTNDGWIYYISKLHRFDVLKWAFEQGYILSPDDMSPADKTWFEDKVDETILRRQGFLTAKWFVMTFKCSEDIKKQIIEVGHAIEINLSILPHELVHLILIYT